ncbi:polyphosphate kinase [Ornatilinea apprima]|uniref:Polyphosphate kinase n=1 Tax=Ornatilinea apprima TaxID=1134406 RepID=A0A0P6XA40_9CHLR|nr:polyphosphate kinase 1 [Ornatilinea apprima]KPL71452.1 polyphosphate kinase [Ornatilinea apprima]
MAENKSPLNLDNPKLYINRELSLLQFQYRVLEEAKDPRNPLLERVKFLTILGSNLDEFFMIRVGGLIMQNNSGMIDLSIDGKTPAEQLAEIRKVAINLMEESRQYFHNVLKPELENAGVHLLDYNDLTDRQRESVDGYFKDVVFPVLTPLAFDPGHPFPHISNLSLNLAILVKDTDENRHFARLKIPASLPWLVPVKRSSGSTRKDGTVPYNHYFVWLLQVITANLGDLFPGMEVVEAHPFHITRNADFEIQELEAVDLLEMMEENVRKRRFGDVVRMMVYKDMPKYLLEILVENLKINRRDVYAIEGPLSLRALSPLLKIDRYDLKDRPFVPVIREPLRSVFETHENSIFHAIRQGNILLQHPYDSFTPVIEFLREAARDPKVLAIKMTLYRVGNNSPVVETLLQARRDYGKQVAVLVELKARFDEESNIGWARMLEQEGVHVTYGLMGLKTHSKVCLVVRREGESIKRYVHLGTGNYNHITAQLYEDIGMLTCDDEIGADVSDLFNYLTGYSLKQDYNKLLVAPINLRQKLTALIQNEIELTRQGEQGHIIFKMNALVDPEITRLLYQASQAGVKIYLVTRGVCSLRPGIKGLSENIRVVSILGRFLEHSRIYYFRNGGNETILMGSADLMPRNLNRRVEVLFPIEDPRLIRHIRENILKIYLMDNTKARLMHPDGSYHYIIPKKGHQQVNAQEWFMRMAHSSMVEEK